MLSRLVWTTNDWILTVLRLLLGITFFAHGAQKALGWFGGPGLSPTLHSFGQMGIPPFLGLLAVAAEFIGGMALIVGFLGRIAALGIIVNMLVAIAAVHAPHGFFMNWAGSQAGEGFEFHLLAIALAFAVLVKGSGALSIDYALTPSPPIRIERRRRAA